jgi:uncharacterized protein YaiI (UPF0178 family)
MKKEETKLISLRCPTEILELIEQHMAGSGFSNRTDAIVDLIRRGSGQPLSVPLASTVGTKDANVIQPRGEEYVSKSDLQELESDLYAKLTDQLNELLNQRLTPLEQGAFQLEQEKEVLLGESAA